MITNVFFQDNNNNPFNNPLYKINRVSSTIETVHSYLVFVVIIQHNFLINLLHFLLSIVYSCFGALPALQTQKGF